jgi:hypothetical protein
MGDGGFFLHIASLFATRNPLLTTTDGGRFDHNDPNTRRRTVELTELGAAVLHGARDRVKTCGIERWLGGVRLQGFGPVWRYDRSTGSLQVR